MTMGVDACRVWAICCVAALAAASAAAAPAQMCAGSGEDDPRAARFCQALNTFLELYAEAAGEHVPEYQGMSKAAVGNTPPADVLRSMNALVRDYPQLMDSGMKRQDVVHSFLRFGRRR